MFALWDKLRSLVEGATFVLLENGQPFSEAKVAHCRLTSVYCRTGLYVYFDCLFLHLFWHSLIGLLIEPGTEADKLGKCKALWGKPRTLLRLSQRSTELSRTRFDEERSKKLWYGSFVREHISPRMSSTVVRVQVVGVCEVRTLAGMPGLVIVLDPAWLANKKEGERWRKIKTTLQSFAASTEQECERQE